MARKKRFYVHYGADRFDSTKFGTIKNCTYPWVKPVHETGMWASPAKSKWGWKDWCIAEGFHPENLKESFSFTLKSGAKVFHVRNLDDLVKLPERPGDSLPTALSRYCIDFEALAKKYDAIEVHLSEDPSGARGDLYYALYGWDCDSILILNPNVVEEVRHEAC